MSAGRCRFDWCQTDALEHRVDPSHHTRDLGHGMLLSVDMEGRPIANWMPDWSEWWINHPEDVTEFDGVTDMLRGLKRDYENFRNALMADPKFAVEVAIVRMRDQRIGSDS
ncbi:conserved hypothetical protein [Microbacterium sp. 8M]|uniref:hypothetical protein n=1 Tax=Microbacterium sp. 8M TaxID=2653153 RepID=UPI0012F19E36|nr:hypothetical protein [Microbacterium sp. 8M]VXC29529.1 conserved hypothetical protein [Microbacterium sp. 8M]